MFEISEIVARHLETIPADLRPDVERSFRAPQFGPYHNEGAFMGSPDSHLERVLLTLEAVARGEFHGAVPDGVRNLIQEAANEYVQVASLYVLLHDIAKRLCLTLLLASGEKRAVTWEQWTALLAETDLGRKVLDGDGSALAAFCQEL